MKGISHQKYRLGIIDNSIKK